jgi:hypothetical protein
MPTEPTYAATPPLGSVIFDGRFSASRAFANRVEQLGAPVLAIEGDITTLWRHNLSERWRIAPIAMAGLTLNGALFCLDMLARNYGMRVVFRREYEQRVDGIEVANVVTRVAERALEVRPQLVAVPHLARPEGNPEPLVSWVIIPAGARID